MLSRSYYPWIGGSERQAQTLSEHLQRLGWLVHVITCKHKKGYSVVAEDSINGVPVHRVSSKGPVRLSGILYAISGFWYLIRHRNLCRGSVFYAHDIGSPAWLAVLARYFFAGYALVKIRSQKKAYETFWSRVQIRWLSRFCDAFIVVNDDGDQILDGFDVPTSKRWRIPNGVDTEKYCPATSEAKTRIRELLGFSTDASIFILVGRLNHVKGHDILIEACRQLNENRGNILFVIAGDGPEKTKLNQLVEKYNLQERVHFAGRIEEPLLYYQAADIFVLPSRGEGLSNAMLEAMACGLPTICSSVGGAVEWVQSNRNGFLFPPANATELYNALVAILSVKERWNEMGNFSRNYIAKELGMVEVSHRFHVQITEELFKVVSSKHTNC